MIQSTPATSCAVLRVGTLEIAFSDVSATLIAILKRRYGTFLVEGSQATPNLVLSLRTCDTIGSTFSSPPSNVENYTQNATVNEGRLTLRSTVLRANVDLRARRGSIEVAHHPTAIEYYLENALRQIFQLLALEQESVLLHAAAVVSPDGATAQVFAGASGAGKSTISELLRDAGCHVLSDDIVHLVLDPQHPQVLSTPFFGTLPATVLRRMSVDLAAINYLEQAAAPCITPVLSTAQATALLTTNIPFTECLQRQQREGLLSQIERMLAGTVRRCLAFRRDLSFLPLIGWEPSPSNSAISNPSHESLASR